MNACTNWLPQNKPRYVMGVGYPHDLLVSVALGADMFDCVWPTRTAVRIFSFSPRPRTPNHNLSQRFGNAIVSTGTLNLRHSSFANDFATIEAGCTCPCCRPEEDGGLGVTRAYIHHVASKETAGAHLCVLPPSLLLCLLLLLLLLLVGHSPHPKQRVHHQLILRAQTDHAQRALPALLDG